MTAPASIYPRTVDELLPEAYQLVAQLGEIPSRNQLMRELGVGAPKASAVREQLLESVDLRHRDPSQSGQDDEPDPGLTEPAEHAQPNPAPVAEPQAAVDTNPGLKIAEISPRRRHRVQSWPILLIALPAAVAIWSGWVGLGRLTGFGPVDLLPGIVDPGGWASIDSAITLPIGVEAYAAYALRAWLSGQVPARARRFARISAIGSLLVGMAGQVAYHLMSAAGMTAAPWQITTAVACLPVAVLGMGAALAHLLHNDTEADR